MKKHAIVRAKERYNLELTEFDLIMISILIYFGLAKKINNEKRNMYGNFPQGDVYHLRYGGKLISPVIVDNTIVTMLPTGKKVSCKKYFRSKQSESYRQMKRRLDK